ncbi:MAG: 2-amino-4-hydroxy-6-hydroxymethyldihydropteridine diphosphokinase [Abditibacteriota bacterium]|nr:2-amino-4-hydroxy-6-hydroxymethyldihydropteridine diphosphokinase [Abditibacteriota bacterium]
MSETWVTAYLSLGSNIGTRAANLREAVQRLERHEAIRVAAHSKMYETQSVEGGGPDDFLNAVLRLQTTLSAHELLEACRAIESTLGRPQPPRHGPRVIDIDILLFGHETHNTPDLQIPHPRMSGRAFVLKPLLDVLEGGWVRETNEVWD